MNPASPQNGAASAPLPPAEQSLAEKVRAREERSTGCLDLLVSLHKLPARGPQIEKLKSEGIVIRKAHSAERTIIVGWAKEKFGQGWADEFGMGFTSHPIRTFVVTKDYQIIGLAVYDATAKGVAGPIGVEESYRKKGVGTALLSEMLQAMHVQGYPYAVIGWVKPATQAFFQKSVGAVPIEGSYPLTGMYESLLIE